ncbi:MAG: NADH-quinone oxidoreductase subunit NuoE [Candidatus Eisenbacteria bacterium]|uniref:NADH-quinone oxidoreductase subunit NuoE n=1 Tax=Eiseniibacteriota bacterium TaxID=2212470 RepID=A0A538TSU6_UNCEI|nr:MAG: NADH-quinone oxidoreductase subunit NuoE [Candidatus Eisenbacteria bacterium]
MLSPQARQKIEALKTVYETNQSALIPALHVAQGEQGWLSEETQAEVATLLELTPQAVREVVSFYTMFHEKPVGKFLLQVCRNLSCSLRGGHRLQRQIEDRLGIHDGETTQDGRFTLESVECLGSCGTAPVLMVNDRYHENVTPQEMDRLLTELK